MNCRDVNDALIGGSVRGEVERHLATCELCRDLVRAMNRENVIETGELENVRNTVLGSLTPVRPLPSTSALAAMFAVVCAAFALGGAVVLHLLGWSVLTSLQRAVIFPLLAGTAIAAAVLSAREMVPAARRMRARTLLLAVLVIIEAAFLLLFHDHSMGQFVHSGIVCLSVGLIVALPAAVLAWAVMRRGAVLDRASAAAAIGILAGLAGLGALELHCPNLRLWHIAVWHVGVLVVSTGVAALAGAVPWRRK